MTLSIALTLGILGIAIFLFITEKIRVDVVALMVLGTLVVANLVTPEEALSGFQQPGSSHHLGRVHSQCRAGAHRCS